jgi:hypothetical protein
MHNTILRNEGNNKMNIELFSGIGYSLTNAIRIDFDSKTHPDIVADVRHLPLRPNLPIEHIHGSPPCTYVSKARHWRWGWDPLGIAESLKLLAAFYEAVAYLGAQKITLEIPRGFEDILGRKIQFRYDKSDIRNATTNFYLNGKSLRRAMIPQVVMNELVHSPGFVPETQEASGVNETLQR